MTQTVAEYRTKINALEDAMRASGTTVDPETLTEHVFCEGVYMRQLRIPKGYTVTGKIHRHACINILLQGKIRIALKDGSQQTMAAGTWFISEPGEKKAGYALEDTLWLNLHAVGAETDLDEIEKKVIVPSYEALEAESQEKLAGSES